MTTRAFFPSAIRALAAFGIFMMPACSPSSPDPASCGPPHATFHLVLDAADGPVPGDIVIDVKYGSGEETFDAKNPDGTPEVVYCRLEFDGVEMDASADVAEGGDDGDASDLDARGDGPGGPHGDGGPNRTIARVVCDLWTDGAADVHITASGYPEVERELSAERDACGLVLSEVAITLERAD